MTLEDLFVQLKNRSPWFRNMTDEEGWLSILESTQVIYYYHGNIDAMTNVSLCLKTIIFPIVNPYRNPNGTVSYCFHVEYIYVWQTALSRASFFI